MNRSTDDAAAGRYESSIDRLLARNQEARAAELTALGSSGAKQRALFDLRIKSAFDFSESFSDLARPTTSPTLETMKSRLMALRPLEQRMHNMHQAVKHKEKTMAEYDVSFNDLATRGTGREQMLLATARKPENKRLAIVEDIEGNNFSPSANTIGMINDHRPPRIPFFAHELRHAFDHLTGKLNASNREHVLASEFNAFNTQEKVAAELGLDKGFSVSALAQARSYEQKVFQDGEFKGQRKYPGTIESSQALVATWRTQQPK